VKVRSRYKTELGLPRAYLRTAREEGERERNRVERPKYSGGEMRETQEMARRIRKWEEERLSGETPRNH